MKNIAKILRWCGVLILAISVKFIVSTIIYNLQHVFNIFVVPVIFLRHFISVLISLYLGFLIAPGNLKSKSIVFSIFYTIFIIAVGINLYIDKASSVRIFAALIEGCGIALGLYSSISLSRYKETKKNNI